MPGARRTRTPETGPPGHTAHPRPPEGTAGDRRRASVKGPYSVPCHSGHTGPGAPVTGSPSSLCRPAPALLLSSAAAPPGGGWGAGGGHRSPARLAGPGPCPSRPPMAGPRLALRAAARPRASQEQLPPLSVLLPSETQARAGSAAAKARPPSAPPSLPRCPHHSRRSGGAGPAGPQAPERGGACGSWSRTPCAAPARPSALTLASESLCSSFSWSSCRMAASSCSVASSFALLSTCSPSTSATFTCASLACREGTPGSEPGHAAARGPGNPRPLGAQGAPLGAPSRSPRTPFALQGQGSPERGGGRRGWNAGARGQGVGGVRGAPALRGAGDRRPPGERTTISGRVCNVDLSWSAGDRVSGRYMARDRMSSEVGISWCRCSSSHWNREFETRTYQPAPSRLRLWPGQGSDWSSPPGCFAASSCGSCRPGPAEHTRPKAQELVPSSQASGPENPEQAQMHCQRSFHPKMARKPQRCICEFTQHSGFTHLLWARHHFKVFFCRP